MFRSSQLSHSYLQGFWCLFTHQKQSVSSSWCGYRRESLMVTSSLWMSLLSEPPLGPRGARPFKCICVNFPFQPFSWGHPGPCITADVCSNPPHVHAVIFLLSAVPRLSSGFAIHVPAVRPAEIWDMRSSAPMRYASINQRGQVGRSTRAWVVAQGGWMSVIT